MATVGVASFVEDTVGFDVSLDDDEGDVVGFGLDVVALGAAVDDAVGAELEGRADDEAVVGATVDPDVATIEDMATTEPPTDRPELTVPCPTLVEVQPATKAPARTSGRTSAGPSQTARDSGLSPIRHRTTLTKLCPISEGPSTGQATNRINSPNRPVRRAAAADCRCRTVFR